MIPCQIQFGQGLVLREGKRYMSEAVVIDGIILFEMLSDRQNKGQNCAQLSKLICEAFDLWPERCTQMRRPLILYPM